MGRRFGQHFLRDPRILDRIVEGIEPGPNDVVLEVGTGLGDLTRRVAASCGMVHSIEIDPALFQRLNASDLNQNIKLYEGDALELDWHRIVGEGPFKVIGNIPYNVTSPLISRALDPPLPEVVVFLMQAEVAERLAAEPGSRLFGALTVGVRAAADVEKLFTVKPGSFSAPPRVDSAVVRIRPLADPLIDPARRQEFRVFVNAVFSQRRKQLQRILRSLAGWNATEAPRYLGDFGIDPVARPETLRVSQFVDLFQAVRRTA